MTSNHSFLELRADQVVDVVEAAMSEEKESCRATGRALALNSLENRVYEVEFEDQTSVVAKFYRPGRWSEDQILDEHDFLFRLEELEVPVVAPFDLSESPLFELCEGGSLGRAPNGIFFAIFPKVRGRLSDELSSKQLETLGRYIGRVHLLGESWKPEFRLKINSSFYLEEPLQVLRKSPLLDDHSRAHYENYARQALELARQKLQDANLVTCHGDCHLGNVLWQGDAPFLMDFDDMMLAPPAQDLWMVVRGRDAQALKDRDSFLKGYEQMKSFDSQQFSYIEVLRAVRIVYYSAWIARRWDDPSFPKAFPSFGTQAYWRSEMEALSEIIEIVEKRPY